MHYIGIKMKKSIIIQALAITTLLLLLLITSFGVYAQMPVCSTNIGGGLVYYMQDNHIYKWNPALPFSATNPILNTITLPGLPPNPGYLGGLTICENLNNPGGVSPTFYSVKIIDPTNSSTWTYAYYDGANWINTGHTAINTNIGGGGGAIYSSNATATGGLEIYKYTGTGNATLLTTIPAYNNGGPGDVQGESPSGNFYVLKITTPAWLRKYSPTGAQLQEWTVTGGPNLAGGGGGYGIINNTVYASAPDGQLYSGAIGATTINLTVMPNAPESIVLASDWAVCLASTNVIPNNTNDTLFLCSSSGTITSGGTAGYSYTIISGNPTVSGTGPSFTVSTNSLSKIVLHSTINSGATNISDTFLIVPAPIVDAGVNDTITGCGSYIGDLNGSISNTMPWITYSSNWTPATTITTGANTLTPSIHPTANTTYVLTVTTDNEHGNCSISDSVKISINDKSVASDYSYILKKGCSADTVVFTNLSQNATAYNWNFGDGLIDSATNPTHIYDVQNNYTVKLTSNNATCKDSILKIVDTRHPLDVSFTVSKDTICINSSIDFTNTSMVSVEPSTYNWNFGDGASSNILNPSHTYTTAGTYQAKLVVTDAVPCKDSALHTIIVDDVSSIGFTQTPRNVCIGKSIQFDATNPSESLENLIWDFGDGTTITNLNPATHAYDHAGIFNIDLKAQFRACPELNYHDSAIVFSFPTVNLGPDTSICLDGNPILLYNLEPTDPGCQYSWNTGDTTVNYSVKHQGIYSLTVTNVNDCSTTDEIVVNKDCYIDIPNSFTPNNDGVNDYFFPRQFLSSGVTGFTMKVFNRWGEVIFETNNTSGRGWDGKFNGKDQPEGVYIYLINLVLKNGRQEKYNGNVTLLR